MSAKWYVVNVHSGCEKKVAQSINEQVALKKWEDRILEILIPTEEIVEVKKENGKQKTLQIKWQNYCKKIHCCYILANSFESFYNQFSEIIELEISKDI